MKGMDLPQWNDTTVVRNSLRVAAQSSRKQAIVLLSNAHTGRRP